MIAKLHTHVNHNCNPNTRDEPRLLTGRDLKCFGLPIKTFLVYQVGIDPRASSQCQGKLLLLRFSVIKPTAKARFPLDDFFRAKRLSIVKIEQISHQFQSRAKKTKEKVVSREKSRLVENGLKAGFPVGVKCRVRDFSIV